MNQKSMKRRLTTGAFAAAVLFFAVGCKTDDRSTSEGFFPDPAGFRSTTSALDAQAANGARQDGMLYAAHFNGGELNSNGADKLNRMLVADAGEPVTVYLNVPTDDAPLLATRQASVTRYLKDAGLTDAQMKLETGANPATWSPAAPLITGLTKTDTGTTSAYGSDSMSATGSASK